MTDSTVKSNKKHKKEPWEIVLKDRFLSEDKQENIYVMIILYILVFFLSFLLIFVCFFQLCRINGDSMLNTLHDGEHVLLLRKPSKFKRGDIVVISKEQNNQDINIIKRVIAIEGDTIRFEINSDNPEYVTVLLKQKGQDEFVLLEENYILEPMHYSKFSNNFFGGNRFKEIAIGEKNLFVMGDNRNNSEDSRGSDGAYGVTNVYGKSVLTLKKGSLLELMLKLLYNPENIQE